MSSAPAEMSRGALAGMLAGQGWTGRNLMVVVAHPDDETIGLGGQLHGLAGMILVHVTDGAPRDGRDAHAHGFPDASAYAAARRNELEAAMALAGVAPAQLVALGLADQMASLALVDLVHRLADLFREHEPGVVLTHAYEGGHPDHDATAFAVQCAVERLTALGFQAPRKLEMPLYHDGPEGLVPQRFADPGPDDLVAPLAPPELARKAAMLACHRSQAETLAQFTAATESLRWAHRHDFTTLPNAGRLTYERWGFELDGQGWLRLAETALDQLGLDP